MSGVGGWLELPVPPSLNEYWRDGIGRRRGGKAFVMRYLTKEARDYKQLVHNTVLAASWRPIPKPTEVAIEFEWHRSTYRREDLDNRLKVLWDALQGAAYDDDCQIARIVATRTTKRGGKDYVRIRLEAISEEQLGLDGGRVP